MDAYEIRLELLKLAQGIESERVWSDRQRLEMDWNTQQNANSMKNYPVPYPELPSVTYKDVVRVAEELNKFVSSKG